ncbi:MAG: VOC family protein [Actinomycetes bacterium]
MRPRLDLLTVAVSDLDVARRFYCEGLGWTATLDVPGEVLFVQVNHGLLLAFFGARDLAADMGVGSGPVVPGSGFTLAHNVDSPAAVRNVLAEAEAAGATIVKPAQRAEWGGFHGYFVDPCGIRWEVAHNSGLHVAPDGTISLGPVE